ncbi:MAG: response regulator [Candidatus Omnitrophica bacterium]|nr:response regulator [Candidatus Omnitrophota bacterium]
MMKTVLIVDGNAENCEYIKQKLEETGRFLVAICLGGEDAVQQAQLLQPDLLLVDVLLPETSGLEVAGQLLEYEDTKHIPVLFMMSEPVQIEVLISSIESLAA